MSCSGSHARFLTSCAPILALLLAACRPANPAAKPAEGYILLGRETAAEFALRVGDSLPQLQRGDLPSRVGSAADSAAAAQSKDPRCSRFFGARHTYVVLLRSCDGRPPNGPPRADADWIAAFRENGRRIGNVQLAEGPAYRRMCYVVPGMTPSGGACRICVDRSRSLEFSPPLDTTRDEIEQARERARAAIPPRGSAVLGERTARAFGFVAGDSLPEVARTDVPDTILQQTFRLSGCETNRDCVRYFYRAGVFVVYAAPGCGERSGAFPLGNDFVVGFSETGAQMGGRHPASGWFEIRRLCLSYPTGAGEAYGPIRCYRARDPRAAPDLRPGAAAPVSSTG